MAPFPTAKGLALYKVLGTTVQKVKYDPEDDRCVHGKHDDNHCDRCTFFSIDMLSHHPNIIASTYPPDLGDPQKLFTSLEDIAEYLLVRVAGLDPTNPQERETAARWCRALRDMTTPEDFNFTTFEIEDLDEMVVEKNIPFSSLCRHHILPFTGVAHIGYVPNKVIAGLSKLPRTVNHFARSLQTQEELTRDIANFLMEKLQPLGVAVFMEAEHSCMTLRGARSSGVTTSTQSVKGVFADHTRTAKAEFLNRIGS